MLSAARQSREARAAARRNGVTLDGVGRRFVLRQDLQRSIRFHLPCAWREARDAHKRESFQERSAIEKQSESGIRDSLRKEDVTRVRSQSQVAEHRFVRQIGELPIEAEIDLVRGGRIRRTAFVGNVVPRAKVRVPIRESQVVRHGLLRDPP